MTCDVQTSGQEGGVRGRMRLEALLTRDPGAGQAGDQAVNTGVMTRSLQTRMETAEEDISDTGQHMLYSFNNEIQNI